MALGFNLDELQAQAAVKQKEQKAAFYHFVYQYYDLKSKIYNWPCNILDSYDNLICEAIDNDDMPIDLFVTFIKEICNELS